MSDATMSDSVLQTFGSLGGTRVVGSEAASQMRVAMVDAVNGDLGRLFAGQGDIRTYAFRVSNMGTLTPRDMEGVVEAFRASLAELRVGVRL